MMDQNRRGQNRNQSQNFILCNHSAQISVKFYATAATSIPGLMDTRINHFTICY